MIRSFFGCYVVFVLFFSCQKKNYIKIHGPLHSIIKLNSAEECKDFDEALKYIDVDKVFKECELSAQKPIECWKEFVNFKYSLGQDKKFNNSLPYYKYKINEIIKGNKAEVIFIPNDAKGLKLSYELELQNTKWVIIKISSN